MAYAEGTSVPVEKSRAEIERPVTDLDWVLAMLAMLLVCVLALLLSGCCPPRLPMRRICADGWPIKILQDPQCPRGVCGYTCAPERWKKVEVEIQP